MPDEMIQDAAGADSSTATTVADPSQATTQPAQQNGDQQQNVPFHEHPRWQQLMRERAAERQELAQLRQFRQQYQQTQQQSQPKSEEDVAREALYRLAPGIQKIDQLEARLQQMLQQQQTSLTTQGRSQLSQMAAEAGLPNDEDSLAIAELAVTHFLAKNPEAVARFRNGDVSVLKDSFASFNDKFVSKIRREQTANLAATKRNLTTQVPPRQSGSQSGAAAPKPLSGDFRKDMAMLNAEADAMLRRA